MSVLVVIPCLNEAAHIGGLLDQFLEDDAVDLIVVADGGSTDGSRDIVGCVATRSDRVRLINNPDRIQSAGINRVVDQMGAPFSWLLRVDAHCLYPENYASMLLEAAHTHGADAVVVPMVTRGTGGFQNAVATAQNSVLGTGGSAHRHVGQGAFVEHGHHALMRMEIFRSVGGYCENMPTNEDAELDHRMAKGGARIWLEPRGSLTYFPRRTPSSLWKQYFRYGVGRARNVLRHRMRPRLRQLIPLAVPIAVVGAALAVIHPVFALPAILWLTLCLLVGAVYGARARSAWGLLSGVAAAIMHLAWGCGFIAEVLLNPGGTDIKTGLAPTPRSSSG